MSRWYWSNVINKSSGCIDMPAVFRSKSEILPAASSWSVRPERSWQPTDRPTPTNRATADLLLRVLMLRAQPPSLSFSLSLSLPLSHHHVAVSSLKQVECWMTEQHCRGSFITYKWSLLEMLFCISLHLNSSLCIWNDHSSLSIYYFFFFLS